MTNTTSFKTVQILTKNGFAMPEIMQTIRTAEKDGEANLSGWVVRYNADGQMIVIHPSWCGIYTGDYSAHIIFQKNISYTAGHFGFTPAKHRDLAEVLDRCKQYGGAEILCECCADSFQRRCKAVEKLGFKVLRSNISACEHNWSTCYFVITAA